MHCWNLNFFPTKTRTFALLIPSQFLLTITYFLQLWRPWRYMDLPSSPETCKLHVMSEFNLQYIHQQTTFSSPSLGCFQGWLLHFWPANGGQEFAAGPCDLRFTWKNMQIWQEFATLDASIGYCFKLMIEGEYTWHWLSYSYSKIYQKTLYQWALQA